MTLSNKEQQEIKKVAHDLLETLKKEKLVLDWRKRQQSRAAVRLSIEEILDRLPRSFLPELYQHKCDMVYQHIIQYDKLTGRAFSPSNAFSQIKTIFLQVLVLELFFRVPYMPTC
jgi:type I restriction enzyme R subunit